ncbi:MAG TPA: hypothetical protein VGB87_01100 [Vicinamibacteria bacterium]
MGSRTATRTSGRRDSLDVARYPERVDIEIEVEAVKPAEGSVAQVA